MTNPLVAKLSSFVDLEPGDVAALEALATRTRVMRPGQDLIKEGDRPEDVFLLLRGWACRYKVLADGRRQIVAFLLPGDLCDARIFILKQMDHSIAAIGEAEVAAVPKERVLDLFEHYPRIARALWWASLVDEATLREWLVNIGQRDAYHSLAHLFGELWLRLRQVGLAEGNAFVMPLTQTELGDTLGLTSVHVNRVLQRMRASDLVRLSHGELHIPDVERLMAETEFEANYLHLDRRLS